MNPAFQEIITANDAERRDLFLGAAARMGTAVQNVEKDFWACWTLDALFNGLAAGGPRLLFKGGTSLSKAFGLISRFSEDIDITVFRDDLGQPADVAELDALSGKKRRALLEAIRNACQAYITGPLMDQFTRLAASAIPEARFRAEPDPDDKDGQSLLFWYPSVTAATGDYIRSAVKIESGAKSALDPHVAAAVTPYVAQDLPNLDLTVTNVTTVKPERTFWDKVIILHCDSGMIDATSSAMAGSAFRAITTTCTSLCRQLRRTSGRPITCSLSTAFSTQGCFSGAPIWDWKRRSPALLRFHPAQPCAMLSRETTKQWQQWYLARRHPSTRYWPTSSSSKRSSICQ